MAPLLLWLQEHTDLCAQGFVQSLDVWHLSRLPNNTCAWRCSYFTPLTPNDPYRGHTAPLTSKVAIYIFIKQICVQNILNMVFTLRYIFSSKFSLFHNSNLFGSCTIHILYTGCAKIKKIISAPKVYLLIFRLVVHLLCQNKRRRGLHESPYKYVRASRSKSRSSTKEKIRP